MRLSSALLAVALVVLAGCGDEGATTSDAPPEIRAGLNEVDNAIIDEDYPDAGQALRDLKRLVNEARAEGTLSDEQASAIHSAANRLLRELEPDRPGEAKPTTVSPPAVETEPEKAKEPKPDEKLDEKPDKSTGKPDHSPGNSENAPGHQDD